MAVTRRLSKVPRRRRPVRDAESAVRHAPGPARIEERGTPLAASPSVTPDDAAEGGHLPTPTVEDRLRLCSTLIEGVYCVNELAGEHEIVQIEGFAPGEVSHQIPLLVHALRDQLAAIRAALPFDCFGRVAPSPGGARGAR